MLAKLDWHWCYIGETEDSHQELVQFCKDFPFQRMGAFTYSEEDGTPAAEYSDQVGLPCTDLVSDLTDPLLLAVMHATHTMGSALSHCNIH